MKTERNAKKVEFDSVGRRKLVVAFDGEHISSDGGLRLLHQTDQRFGLLRKFARWPRQSGSGTNSTHASW